MAQEAMETLDLDTNLIKEMCFLERGIAFGTFVGTCTFSFFLSWLGYRDVA